MRIIRLIIYSILVFQSFFVSAAPISKTEIHGIDVGYGDAVLLRFHSGPVILIDGGYAGQGRKVVEYLKSHHIENLDIVICTHSHSDHAGGLREVIQSFIISEIWTNGEKIDWLYDFAKRRRISLLPLKKGIFSINDQISVEVLNVWQEGLDPNEGSLALIFNQGKQRLFFAGDISMNVQKTLLDSGKDLSAEFLKVPHHGWEVSSQFLGAVHPKTALISVGPNPYGAPEDQSVETLSRLGSKVYRTDREGTVVILIGEDNKKL